MIECKVLRCDLPGEHVLAHDSAIGIVETWVCGPHHVAISAGERWVWDPTEDEVHMGSDVPPLLLGAGSRVGAFSNFDGSRFIYLEIENPDGTMRDLQLQAPPEVLDQLRRAIAT
jgi:hypothetical protein